MRKNRFSEERINGILKEHQAGKGAKDLCRKHGVSDGTWTCHALMPLRFLTYAA